MRMRKLSIFDIHTTQKTFRAADGGETCPMTSDDTSRESPSRVGRALSPCELANVAETLSHTHLR